MIPIRTDLGDFVDDRPEPRPATCHVMEQYGELLGREAEATGHNVFLGACLTCSQGGVAPR